MLYQFNSVQRFRTRLILLMAMPTRQWPSSIMNITRISADAAKPARRV